MLRGGRSVEGNRSKSGKFEKSKASKPVSKGNKRRG
jgi:hypothetical protein